MSEYVEYLVWLMWGVAGFGVGRLTWRQKFIGAPPLPAVAPEPLTITSWSGEGLAPFRVVTLDGDVRYEGAEGGPARRHIEVLRSERIEWRAYRDGRVWDWGPRE